MQATQITKKYLPSTKLLGMDVRPGDTVRVHERVQEGGKERVAIFEGLVIARRHGQEPGASITVRKITKGIGVERVFPLAMPALEKIDIVRRAKVRRAKLNYIRSLVGKRATLKGDLLPPGFGQPTEQEEIAAEEVAEEADEETAADETTEETVAGDTDAPEQAIADGSGEAKAETKEEAEASEEEKKDEAGD